MRTVILLGLMSIAMAINSKLLDSTSTTFIAWVCIVVMAMDIIEFLMKFETKKTK